jgi:hypothetical protein
MAIQTLFTDINQVKEYITVDIGSNINMLLPYIKQAEKYVKDVIGTDLFNELLEYVQASDSDNDELEALLPYVRMPLINFAYKFGAPKLSVNIGKTGITTTESNNVSPAEDWRMKDLINSFASSGYSGLEELLEFLEENKEDYTSWSTSSAYSFQKKFFVNNAKELNESIFINIERYDFLKLKPYIHQIEQSVIKKAISTELFDVMKEKILAGDLSEENEILLLDYIRPSVCYMALNKFKD